jgi:hypothetical protein
MPGCEIILATVLPSVIVLSPLIRLHIIDAVDKAPLNNLRVKWNGGEEECI